MTNRECISFEWKYQVSHSINGAAEDSIDGEQFRSLVYAVSIPFCHRECHPLSPAVLLFLFKKYLITLFDAVGDKLPIVVQGDRWMMVRSQVGLQ